MNGVSKENSNNGYNSSIEEIKDKVEAILFSYADWISVSDIVKILNLDSENLVKSILEDLKIKFSKGFSFEVVNDYNMWKMKIRKEYENLLHDFLSNYEIPKSALKVLAVIAYEQPITKTRLNEILGKSVIKEINYLLKRGFISYFKRGIGRYYKVTKKFKDYFQVDDIKEFRKKFEEKIKLEKQQDLSNLQNSNNNADNLNNIDNIDDKIDNNTD